MKLSTRLVAMGALLTAIPAAAATTAQEALARLKDGNARFVAGTLTPVASDRTERERVAKGESPLAAVLSCADSRVPPEFVFNSRLGELYVVRTAGHVADKSAVASVEHATEDLHAPLIVVMGHSMCGVVQKAVSAPAAGVPTNVAQLLAHIRPAADRVASQPEDDRVRAAIFANVEQSINDLLRQSPAVAAAVDGGRVQVVGAYYDMASGRVMFTKPVTQSPVPVPSGTTTGGHAPSAPAGAGHADGHGASAHASNARPDSHAPAHGSDHGPAGQAHAPSDHGKH